MNFTNVMACLACNLHIRDYVTMTPTKFCGVQGEKFAKTIR